MGMIAMTIGNLREAVCFKCKTPLEDREDFWSWVNFQAIYGSRRGHNYCHNCYKCWLPEEEK